MFLRNVFFIAISSISYLGATLSFSSPTVVHRVMDEDVLNPQLALHPTYFSAAAVWVSQKASSYEVQGSFFDGSSWSSSSVLGSSETEPSPLVKIDGNGRAVAIWDSFDGSNLTLQAAHFNGSTWSSGSNIQSLGTAYYASRPNLAMNGAGYGVATWLSSSLELIGSTYNPNSTSWSSAYPISQEGVPLSASVMAPIMIDSNNQLTAILPLSDQIASSSFDALNPPLEPGNMFLRLITAEATIPNIAQSPLGDFSLFIAQASVSHHVISATRAKSGDWNFLLAGTPGSSALNLSAAINPSNTRGAAAWQLSNGYIQVAFYNFVSWQFVKVLSTQGLSPSLSFYQDTSDHLAAIWADQAMGPSNFSVYFSEYNSATNLWSSPTPISTTSTFVDKPRIASLENGQTIAIWTRLDSTVGPTPRKIIEAAVGTPDPSLAEP